MTTYSIAHEIKRQGNDQPAFYSFFLVISIIRKLAIKLILPYFISLTQIPTGMITYRSECFKAKLLYKSLKNINLKKIIPCYTVL